MAVGPPSLYCIGMPTVLPRDPVTCGSVGVSPRDSCEYLVMADNLIFFPGTGRVFLTRGGLNDPCRGRRWGLVGSPHPVNKILLLLWLLSLLSLHKFCLSIGGLSFCILSWHRRSALSPSPYGYGRASGTGSHAHRHLLPVGAFAFFMTV